MRVLGGGVQSKDVVEAIRKHPLAKGATTQASQAVADQEGSCLQILQAKLRLEGGPLGDQLRPQDAGQRASATERRQKPAFAFDENAVAGAIRDTPAPVQQDHLVDPGDSGRSRRCFVRGAPGRLVTQEGIAGVQRLVEHAEVKRALRLVFKRAI